MARISAGAEAPAYQGPTYQAPVCENLGPSPFPHSRPGGPSGFSFAYRFLLSADGSATSAAARLQPTRRSFTLCNENALPLLVGAVIAKKSARFTSSR